MNLAQSLWQQTAQEEAAQELQVAQELFSLKDTSVLGVSTTPLNLLTSWRQEPQKKAQEKQFWQNIVSVHPDYRDGYVQLASLAYDEGNLPVATDYILKAQG